MTNGYGGYTPLLDRWLGALGWQRVSPDMIDDTVERLAAETRRLDQVEGRAMRMYRHGTPLSHLFAATVLGIQVDNDRSANGTGVRVDGTSPPDVPTPELTDARELMQHVSSLRHQCGEVDLAWRELLAANPDARHLGGPASAKLWAALDALVAAVDQVEAVQP